MEVRMNIFRRLAVIGSVMAAALLGVTVTAITASAATPSTAHAVATPARAPAAVPSADRVATITIHTDGKMPFSGTGCTHNIFGTQLVCIYVNGTGLIVNYATVTNKHAPTGRAMISDTYDGQTYAGPDNFSPGHAWRHNFYLHFNQNDKVCGSVSGLDVACLTIHR
jgi:hypothetical protein